MREIKFRAWDTENKTMHYSDDEVYKCQPSSLSSLTEFFCHCHKDSKDESFILMQYTGLKDKNGKEYFHKDIGEFGNGDRFIIKCEDWLEFFVEWIGEPECEDQARDFYRIDKSKNLGNEYENPELLNQHTNPPKEG